MSAFGLYMFITSEITGQGKGTILLTLPSLFWVMKTLHTYIYFIGSILHCALLDRNPYEVGCTVWMSLYTLPDELDVEQHLWETFRGSFICFIIEEGVKMILKLLLLQSIFIVLGIEIFLEEVDFKPVHNDLRPLVGGQSNLFCWRRILIDQCWKRKRKRRRKYTGSDVVRHWLNVRKWESAATVMTKPGNLLFPIQKASDLVHSLDILDMHHLMDADNVHQFLARDAILAETSRLRNLMETVDYKFGSILGPLELISYNSVIPQVIMESVHLSTSSDTMPIVVDTGASRSLSPHRSDFITFKKINLEIGTINAASSVEGIGTVRWKVTDQCGVTSTVETEAYYVPSASIRLYSPQFHFREHCEGSLQVNHVGITLNLPHRKSGPALSFPFNAVNNLPLMLTSNHPHFKSALFSACSMGEDIFAATNKLNPILRDIPVVEYFDIVGSRRALDSVLFNGEHRANLSSAQLELRLLHNKMGHLHMKRIQRLTHHNAPLDSQFSDGELSSPIVFRSRLAKTRTCSMPLCRACALAKMTKIKTNTQHHTNDPAKEMALQREHLTPGDCISWDQYVVPHRGRLYKSAGKERENMRYAGGSLAVDHASKRVFIHHQVALTANLTLEAKRLLERDAREVGVHIKRYHADNGIFASSEFRDDCKLKDQKLTFSASNSHHQNGVAERYIGTISRMARSMLIHSALLWPRRHNINLWPMAMDHAVWVWNNVPMDDGLSPEEKWASSKFSNYDHLRKAHVFGCPAYVLHPKLVEGSKIPKWDPRSRQGKFVGYSKEHASNAGLILNPTTGFISPQYHVLYDDEFQTVPGCDENQQQNLLEADWATVIERQGGSEINYRIEDQDMVPDELDDSWLTQAERVEKQARIANRTGLRNQVHNRADVDQQPILRNDPAIIVVHGGGQHRNPPQIAQPINPPEPANQRPLQPAELDQAREEVAVRRSGRARRQNQPLQYTRLGGPNERRAADYACGSACNIKSFCTHAEAESYQNTPISRMQLDNYFVQDLNWKDSVAALASESKDANGTASRFFAAMDSLQDPRDGVLDQFPTLAFATKASDADNPRFEEAMNGPNSKGFWEAAVKELCTLQNINTWEMVKREPWMNVIQCTWAFKIKRFPDGLVRKLKARLCVRGDQQIEGVDFFDTFAPVVQWSTIRIMFILSLQLGLASTQVDYVSAFCQAPIDSEVYVGIPRGWETLNEMGISEKIRGDCVFKLKRSMYGLRQSPRNFFLHLKKNLEKAHFKQSAFDPCLFVSDDVICVCYVDDCLWWSKDQSSIDKAIERVKVNMDLEVEDSVDGFLGISVDHKKNESGENEIHLTQKGLIQRVIVALGLDVENSNGIRTPAPENAPLPRDKDGPAHDLGFNYPSVVGMMMYLCNNSRPDIAFAVHQCARHSFSPKRKHAEYLKRIGRYLLATKDNGLIIKPNEDRNILDVDCYVDADFAGLFSHEDKTDPHCVKSRTGYVINMGGSPIIWASRLQPIISSSTMESEYIALSTACKDLIPLRNIIREIASACGVEEQERSSMHTTIWEDNVGALTLANMELPFMTPRSKAIAVRYHWFRQFVSRDEGKDGGIVIKKVDTKNQIADIFTKGLGRQLFEKLRKMLMGW